MKLPKKPIYRILILTISGIFIISLLNFYRKEVKNLFYLLSAPIQSSFWQAGIKVSDFFELITEIKKLKKENEELKLKNQALLSKIAELESFKKENEILREALNIGLEKEFKLKIVKVISKEVSQDVIEINKGSEDGLLENLPVITQQKILVGKISKVYKNFSKVILISDKNSSLDVKISGREVSGLVKGKGSFKIFLELIPKEEEVSQDEVVITSVLGGIFPEGLLVGKIKEVKKSDIEPFQQAEISPLFDIKNLKTLFIITEF